jgi:hypothetical protein
LNNNGLKCRRIKSVLELNPQAPSAVGPDYARVVEILKKSEKKPRPRKRKTLSGYIIIDMLLAKKMVSETGNAMAYPF